MRRYEYKLIDTGKDVERRLNELGAHGWRVVGVTTKKQLFIAPPQAIILMREAQPARTFEDADFIAAFGPS
jgi:hypothetical protein